VSELTEQDLHALRPMDGHTGLSGARLLRAHLSDGRSVVVKQSCGEEDVFQQLLGHTVNLEYLLWREGVFGRLPKGVTCPVLGGWADAGGATIVMEDIGPHLFGAGHKFTPNELRTLVRQLHLLHSAKIRPKTPITSLERTINTFAPLRVQCVKRSPFLEPVERGLEALSLFCSRELHTAVIGLSRDASPLVRRLLECPSNFCHGDIAGVNAGLCGDELILIDWGQAFHGPPELDLARFLPSGLRHSACTNDWLIDEYATIVGASFNARAMRLSLLGTLLWFGWRKAIDALEHPEPSRRQIEKEELEWWSARAGAALQEL
jgi:hypothetical protein